jgi:hypothetical protein
LVWLALVAFLLVPGVASAATLTVSNTGDAGAGSLRATIASASAGDTVFLPASSNHYTVSSEIPVTVPLTIQGAASGSVIVDGGGNTRIFHVGSGLASADVVTITGLTLTGGATTSDPGGGAILVGSGTLNVTDATLSNDTATVDIGPGRAGAAERSTTRAGTRT